MLSHISSLPYGPVAGWQYGNRLSRSGNVSESYDIDPLSNRLLTVSRGDTSRQFSYDANGNVVSETGFDGSVRSYGYKTYGVRP